MAWEKEARTLRWFGLQDGMSVLELGSGPGFVTGQLLDLLPNSPVTALEIAPLMIEKARQYLGERAGDRLSFVEGSIMDTGLPDDHFDFAIARMLFQHLSDPVGAVVEVRRVLKPGGRLAIIDIDDEVWGLSDPEIPEMDLIIERYGQAQAARGGNRQVGRRLWQILASAGFTNLDLEAVVAHSDVLGLDPFLPMFDLGRLSGLMEVGLLSESDMAQIRASQEALLAADRPYIMMLILLACGQKPQA
jgi:ubiquinone/menaquinone biosynthesis C-methylase UbiE